MKLFWFFQSSADRPGAEAGGSARWVIWTTLLALLVFGWWANWAKLDQVTRAPGSVIASSRTQVIQSQDGGTVEEMRVKEGDVVEDGRHVIASRSAPSRDCTSRRRSGMRRARISVTSLRSDVVVVSNTVRACLGFRRELGKAGL